LEKSLKVATCYQTLRKEVDGYKDQIRVAVLKKDEAELKREKAEESLRAALEANTRAEERIKALEAEAAEREKAAFAWGRVEAEAIMTNQLPRIYNEAFHEGWKALSVWPESEEVPFLPPRESLPYPEAPIGVPEEEVSKPLPHPPVKRDAVPPSD
jgi:hypothetical protein